MFYLPAPLYEQLRKVAFKERTSLSAFIREEVARGIERRTRAKKRTRR